MIGPGSNGFAARTASILSRILDDHLDSLEDLTGWISGISEPGRELASEVVASLDTVPHDTVLSPAGERELVDGLIREESLAERLYRVGVENADLPDRLRFLLASKLLPGRQRNRALLELAASSTNDGADPAAMPAG